MIAGIGFFGGCTYQSRHELSNQVAEQKQEIVVTNKVNTDVNDIAGKNEVVKEKIRTVYVPKTVEKIKIEIRDNPIYIEKACVLPQSGIDLLDSHATELNKIFEETK